MEYQQLGNSAGCHPSCQIIIRLKVQVQYSHRCRYRDSTETSPYYPVLYKTVQRRTVLSTKGPSTHWQFPDTPLDRALWKTS